METGINTYSPNDVVLTISGFTCQAWKSISVNNSVPGYRTIRGIRGKNTRVRNKDTSCTIAVTVMQTSHTNDVLSQIHEADLTYGTAILSVMLKDKSGSSVFYSNEAYIVDYPSVVFNDRIEYREWRIFCQSTDVYVVGGNNTPETNLFDSLTANITGLLT